MNTPFSFASVQCLSPVDAQAVVCLRRLNMCSDLFVSFNVSSKELNRSLMGGINSLNDSKVDK